MSEHLPDNTTVIGKGPTIVMTAANEDTHTTIQMNTFNDDNQSPMSTKADNSQSASPPPINANCVVRLPHETAFDRLPSIDYPITNHDTANQQQYSFPNSPSTNSLLQARNNEWNSLHQSMPAINQPGVPQPIFGTQQPSTSSTVMPSPQISVEQTAYSNSDIATINIGGKRFRLKLSTITQGCDATSKLAKLARLSEKDRKQHMGTYIPETDEFFFERPPDEAKLLAQYCMSGIVHKPQWMCFELFSNAITYWCIPDSAIGDCCRPPVKHDKGDKAGTSKGAGSKENSPDGNADPFNSLCLGDTRRKIWKLFEEPQSSAPAKAISMVSMAFILASLSGLILSSMEDFQVDPPPPDENGTTVSPPAGPRDPIPILVYMEICCVIWFSFEFMIRLIVCADKCGFLTTALNLVDAATVIPFYAETCLPLVGVNAESLKRVTGVMLVVRALRVLRVARLFKLARYSSALQIMGDTFRKSAQELSMLVMLLSTGIIFFATILYFLENDVDSGFSSIPASCWWCVVTMTTVGYGDVVPHTPAGKIVATVTSICGIIVLAFPISLIVEKFATAQEQMEGHGQANAGSANGAAGGAPGTPKVRKVFGGKFGGRRRKPEPSTIVPSNY